MILVVQSANIQRALGRKNKLENFSARKFSFGEKKNSGALLLPIWVKVFLVRVTYYLIAKVASSNSTLVGWYWSLIGPLCLYRALMVVSAMLILSTMPNIPCFLQMSQSVLCIVGKNSK